MDAPTLTTRLFTALAVAAAVAVSGGCQSGGNASGAPAVSTSAPAVPAVSADIAAAVGQRVTAMWPDINLFAHYGGGGQVKSRDALNRLGPRTGSIGTDAEYQALLNDFEMAPVPDANTDKSDITLVSQAAPIDFSTAPPPPRLAVPVCYSYVLTPAGGGQGQTVFMTALLGLRNPSGAPQDLADPAMWGLISVENITKTNGC